MDWSTLSVLITGGTGSFGKKCTEILLRDYQPKVIRIYSRDEVKQFDMRRQMPDPRLRFLIGDVRDKERLYRAMNGINLVIHAAALKQVPTAEYNPLEAVKTNIHGTINVVDTAIDNGVQKVLFISTDKAVHPVNLYGATKLVAEKLCIQANAYVGFRPTQISCVRYGNVVGSRGSVIPIFLEQAKEGKIQLTDERMTRFWITTEQGVRFVISCLEKMQGGEVFVPKIPSMRLVDMARIIAPKAQWEVVGIRPGEKLHEEMVTTEEAPYTQEFDRFYRVEPQHPFWNPRYNREGGKPVPSGFSYRSDTNTWWLTEEELKAYLSKM